VAVGITPDESMYETALVPSIGGGGVIGMIAQSIGVGVGQESRIGDLVPSVMKDGVKHFVSPKKTEQLDDEYVIQFTHNLVLHEEMFLLTILNNEGLSLSLESIQLAIGSTLDEVDLTKCTFTSNNAGSWTNRT
jgi:hypothetical protein